MSSKQSITTLVLSKVASGPVTIYRAVGYGGAQAAVAGQAILGFADETASDGKAFGVNVAGTILAEAGGTFSAGDALTVDSSGRVVGAAALGIDATKLTIANGATGVTSTAANGAIIGATSGVLTGGVLPVIVCGRALAASTGVGQVCEILRIAA